MGKISKLQQPSIESVVCISSFFSATDPFLDAEVLLADLADAFELFLSF